MEQKVKEESKKEVYFDSLWNKMQEVRPEDAPMVASLFTKRYRLAIKAGTLAMVDKKDYIRAVVLGRKEYVWVCIEGGLVVSDEEVYAWQVAEQCLLIK